MSRLPRSIKGHTFTFLLTALIAWSLVLPLLFALHLKQETLMALIYALLASGVITLYSLIPRRVRFLVPLGVIVGTVASALLLKGSIPARVMSFARSLASGAALTPALTLYMNALLPVLLLLLVLFARLLMEGDPSFTLPLMVTPMLMLWFLGAREDIKVFLPAALCLPLLYIYITHLPEERPLTARPKTLLIRALAIALALVFLAFALTPQERQTIPKAEQMADDLRRYIEDLFFFTASRNMFTLRSQGYQPMGEKGLGGKPDISWTPVLNVRTTERLYLRGTVLDTYTGRSWYDSLSNQRFGWLSPRYAGLRTSLFNEDLPQTERVESRQAAITMLSDMPSTLFIPQRLRELTLGPNMVGYFNASSEMFITRDLKNGDSYSFRYEPYVAGESRTDVLARKLSSGVPQTLPDLAPEYTTLPKHLQPDGIIAELARKIVGQETNPYQQAQAIKNYLKTNYAYTTDVPLAPEKQDFAAHFLFDLKGGYCTYFATAMTVLSRSVGLPARYVEGFLALPEGSDSVTLTGMNAHAWTEIYIAGLGWVIFDATATDGSTQNEGGDQPPPPQPPSPSPSPSPTPSPEPSEEPSPKPEEQPQSTPTPPPEEEAPTEEPAQTPDERHEKTPDKPFPWWILLLILALGLFIWRLIEEDPLRRERKLRKPEQVLHLYWSSLLAVMKAKGQAMNAQETPLSYAYRVSHQPANLLPIASAQSAMVYGHRKPNQEILSLARETYKAQFTQLPLHKKAWLMAARAASGVWWMARHLPTVLLKKIRQLMPTRRWRGGTG
ncbi:MAG: transglutaminase domain-containing protein [Clostridiales bacterium]|nr:transglutaminase domain-containing protein [Clostridiales bacterium]